jgi:hypothetical protein
VAGATVESTADEGAIMDVRLVSAVALVLAAACGGGSAADQPGPVPTDEPTDEVANDEVANDEVATDEVANDEVANDEVANDEVATTASTTSSDDEEAWWPRPRGYHEAVYDVAGESLLIVGGCTGPQCSATNETWAFDPRDATWTTFERTRFMTPAGGPVVYDAESDRVIALEVFMANPNETVGTWVFDRVTGTWTDVEAEAQPRLGVGARMAYDEQSDRVIAFGGFGNLDDDWGWTTGTWAYDDNANTWTDMMPTVEPPGINYHAFTYDAESDRVVLFGLQDGGATLMWTYDYDANTWEELDKSSGPNHAPAYARAFYHPPTDRIVYFGGWGPVETDDDMQTQHQVWTYDLNSNSWEQKGLNPLSGPIAWHTLTYIDSIDRALVFGGGASWEEYTGDRLFSYAPSTDEWTEITQM